MQARDISLLISKLTFSILTEIIVPIRQIDDNFICRGFLINTSDSVITSPSTEISGFQRLNKALFSFGFVTCFLLSSISAAYML